MSVDKELQEAAETGSLVIGMEETLKDVESLEKVVLASNTPPYMEGEVREAAEEEGVEVLKPDADNRELGSMCMKPFSASVVGLR